MLIIERKTIRFSTSRQAAAGLTKNAEERERDMIKAQSIHRHDPSVDDYATKVAFISVQKWVRFPMHHHHQSPYVRSALCVPSVQGSGQVRKWEGPLEAWDNGLKGLHQHFIDILGFVMLAWPWAG